eukprot:4167726-Heterocapsa_arctica.AAC.1
MSRFCGFLSGGNAVFGFGITYLARCARRRFLVVGTVGFPKRGVVLAGVLQVRFPWKKVLLAG